MQRTLLSLDIISLIQLGVAHLPSYSHYITQISDTHYITKSIVLNNITNVQGSNLFRCKLFLS